MQLSIKKERMRRPQSDKDHLSKDKYVRQRKRSSGAGEGTETTARRP